VKGSGAEARQLNAYLDTVNIDFPSLPGNRKHQAAIRRKASDGAKDIFDKSPKALSLRKLSPNPQQLRAKRRCIIGFTQFSQKL
jgi:hypothetical protein